MRLTSVIILGALAASVLPAQNDRENQIQNHYRRAQEALSANRFDEAENEFRAIIRLDPKLAAAHANLGVIHYARGNYSEASKCFREALKLDPSLSKAENFLGVSEARQGHMAEALPILEKSFKNSAVDELRIETGLLLLENYNDTFKFDKAVAVLQSLQHDYPNNSEVLYHTYRLHSDIGAKALAELVRVAPDSARLHQVTAELLESEGDYVQAVDQYRRALKVNPKMAGLHRALGVALLSTSQEETTRQLAQREFEMELAANPSDEYSEYQLGEIYWLRHEPEQARRHFTRAVELRSGFVDALLALAKVWGFEGQPAKQVEVLSDALKIDPQNEVAHYRLAQAYTQMGRKEDAARELVEFKKLRQASASISSIYQQVRRRPITEQTVEPEPDKP